MRKALCYRCDNKWGHGRIYKKLKVYLFQGKKQTEEEEISKGMGYMEVAA